MIASSSRAIASPHAVALAVELAAQVEAESRASPGTTLTAPGNASS